MNSPVDLIKARLSIVDVISSYIKVEKSGLHYKARCPFHHEKTPSFFVSSERNTFHCFGCGKGGDVFTFVQDIEGIEFKDALKLLAEKAGILLSTTDVKKESEEGDLFGVLLEATLLFEANLEKNKDAFSYITGRGILPKTIKEFRIGYAPEGWRILYEHLRQKGFSDEVMEKAGLIIKSPKGYYDRFRGRIMFPIANSQGKIVAFSGRVFPEPVDDAKITAKYINSPETLVYSKSKILFGYDKAKQAISKAKRAILVEGQMDLVMAHQAGTKEAVAVSGTALTLDHIGLIKRFTDKLILAFDADQAGFNASERSVDLALQAGIDVGVVRLPEGKDPADVIREDANQWSELLNNSRHLIEVYIEVLRSQYKDDREFKNKVGSLVLPYISRIQNPIDRTHFVSYTARQLGVSEEVILESLLLISKEAERYTSRGIEEISKEHIKNSTRKERVVEMLYGTFLLLEKKDKAMATYLLEKSYNFLKIPLPEYCANLDKDKIEEYVFEAELRFGDTLPQVEAIDDILVNLHRVIVEERIIDLTNHLNQSERDHTIERSNELMKQIGDLRRELEDLQKEILSK